MAKNDSGDWHLGSAAPKPMSIRERVDMSVTLVSPEQIKVMKDEEAFLRTVKPFTTKRFTDRRPIPGRDRLIP